MRGVLIAWVASGCALPLDIGPSASGGGTLPLSPPTGSNPSDAGERIEDAAMWPATPEHFLDISFLTIGSSPANTGVTSRSMASLVGAFGMPFDCQPIREGDCLLYPCRLNFRSSTGPNAGTLRFDWEDGGATVPPARRFRETDFTYNQMLGDLEPGSTLRVQAEGGTLPAFTASIVLPSNLRFALPGTVSRASALRVPVPTPTAGRPHLQMMASSGEWNLMCNFTTPGEGVVPASLMARLSDGPVNVSTGAASASREVGSSVWLLGRNVTYQSVLLDP